MPDKQVTAMTVDELRASFRLWPQTPTAIARHAPTSCGSTLRHAMACTAPPMAW